MRCIVLAACVATALAHPRAASAQETCGDHVDNDADNLADEGCWSDRVSGIVTQPGGVSKTGSVAPKSGQLVWPEPPDLAPSVAYGGAITFRRTYFSLYNPGYQDPNDTDFRAPMGRGWQHNFMSFLDLDASANPDEVVVHTTDGRDVQFSYASNDGTWDYYTPQAGYHFIHLRQKRTSPFQWELKDLTGWIFEYSYSGTTGKLAKITDPLANVVTITYNGDGQVDKVLDATGNRGLEFSYYSSTTDKLLQYVKYRTYSGGSGTDRVTLELTYSSYKLTAAKIGTTTPSTFRNYTYDSNSKLIKIEDAESTAKVIAEFKYLAATAGKVARVETPDGTFGWEFASSGCDSGNGTYVTYHRSSASSGCSSCAGDEYCGGKTDPSDSSTGLCFEARVCLAITSPNEDLVGAVTASCTSCADTAQYTWDTASGKLDLQGRKSPRADGGNEIWTTYEYNSNGLVTKMIEGDTNSDPSSVPGTSRVTFYKYDNSSFPGLVTEVRRKSELSTSTCDASTTTGCKRTIYAHTSGGLLDTLEEIGFTETATGGVVSYAYTTDYSYDSQGRVTQIDGPRTDTSYDITEFTYWSSSGDVFKDYFLKEVKRKKATSTYVTTTYDEYDYWGNPKQVESPSGDATCHVYDGARNVLTSRRATGNNQSDCTTTHSSDTETQWTYDTTLRTTKETQSEGNCIHYEYDSAGRLSKRKDRDDCTASSAGDTIEYTYSADGLLTKIEYKDDAGTVTWRQESAYRADRRLDTVKNPVSTYTRQWSYENDGLVKQLTGENGISKTDWLYDALGRLDVEKRYTTSSASDDWTLTPGVQLELPTQVIDDDGNRIDWKWDDMGRKVKQVTLEAGTNWYLFDPAGNLTEVKLAYGTADTVTNTYTFDSLNRLTAENTGDTSCGGEQGAEIQYVYDSVSCPSGQSCNNVGGRLAYVKLKLACDTSKDDDTIDQETFYNYSNVGNMTAEFIQDDTGRTALTSFHVTENGIMTKVTPPSGIVYGVSLDNSAANSDATKVKTLYRIEDSTQTNMATGITWMPFGPIDDFTQEHTKNGNKIKMRPTYNLAYRPSQYLWEETTSGTDIFKIIYTEDDKGRITARDFTGAASGVQDAVYKYDWQDRVECDALAFDSGACPVRGSANLKSSMTGTPPFTQSNDRVEMTHYDPLVGEDKYTHARVVVVIDQVEIPTDQIDYIDKYTSSQHIELSWDTRGNRIADDDLTWEDPDRDDRVYAYDARNNLIAIAGEYLYASNDWNPYTITNIYDQKNRRIFKSFLDSEISEEAQWYFTYDQKDRLVEVKHIPDTDVTTTYSIYDFYWIGDRPVAYYQLDFATGAGTVTTRRFLHADEINRPLEAWSWPTSGDASRVWAINPDLFAWDYIAVGSSIYQPLRFPGQHYEPETVAYRPDGSNSKVARPGLHHSSDRLYDPLIGGYLSVESTSEPVDGAVYSFWGDVKALVEPAVVFLCGVTNTEQHCVDWWGSCQTQCAVNTVGFVVPGEAIGVGHAKMLRGCLEEVLPGGLCGVTIDTPLVEAIRDCYFDKLMDEWQTCVAIAEDFFGDFLDCSPDNPPSEGNALAEVRAVQRCITNNCPSSGSCGGSGSAGGDHGSDQPGKWVK